MLTLEAAKSMKTLGYPQDQWPQFVRREGGKRARYVLRWAVLPKGYFACPSEVEALDWLQEHLFYYWSRNDQGWYFARPPEKMSGDYRENVEILVGQTFANASELVLAIKSHWLTRQVVAQ